MTHLEIVRRICAEVGFTPPREGETLLQWTSSVLDSPLAPRGGVAWQSGHERLLEIARLAASPLGSPLLFETVARTNITEAREIVRQHGNDFCACASRIIARDHATGRQLCMRCGLRARGMNT